MHLSGQQVTGKNKQFSPIDFLRRAEKLSAKYSENDLMLRNIRGTLAKIEAATYREPSTMQSLKTCEQTGMVSHLSEKRFDKDVERASHSASIQSRMLKRSQASQPQIRPTNKMTEDKRFRVTSNPKIQGINELRQLFSGVVQIKVEPNIRILTKADDHAGSSGFNLNKLRASKSIMCTNCKHKFSVNHSRGNTERTLTEGRVSIKGRPRESSKRMYPKVRGSSDSLSASSHNMNPENSITSKKKLDVIVKKSDHHKQSSSAAKRNSIDKLNFKGNQITIDKSRQKDRKDSKVGSLRNIPKAGDNYDDIHIDSWGEKPKGESPRLRTNSGNEINSMAKSDNYLQLTNSNFASSPDTRTHHNHDLLIPGDERENSSTPAFEGRIRTIPAAESRFKVESVRAHLKKESQDSLPQISLIKQEAKEISSFWQIQGDSEMRVAKHKEIYERV